MARTFEVLSPYGWEERDPHRLSPGSTIRVLDDGTLQNLAPAMSSGDTGIYMVTRVQTNVGISVGTASGPTEVAVPFETP